MQECGFGFLGVHPAEELIRLVTRAEELGFSSAWLAEDYFHAGAFSLASAAAARTGTIRLGIGVINPFTRHPVLSAMEGAALDAVSRGRAVLGIGGANKLWMETRLGMPYHKPITAVRECAEIIRELIRQGELTYHGEIFHVDGVHMDFEPFRRALPVYLGVKGDRALFAAGQVADGVLLSAGCTAEYVRYARTLIAQGAESAGRDPKEIRIAAYLPTLICGDNTNAREMMRPVVRRYLGLHGDKPILTCAGLAPDTLRPFREAFLRGEVCEAEVTDEMVEKIVIAGTPEHCRARLAEYRQAGVEEPIFFEVPGTIPAEEQMRLICKELMT